MPRKRKHPEFPSPIAGRPPKDALEKIGRPVRALVTLPVMDALRQDMRLHDGLTISEMLRLALYRELAHQGLITPALQRDPTWESLAQKGLV